MQEIRQVWSLNENDIYENLSSSNDGLNTKEANIRLEKYGENIFHNREKKNIFSIFFRQFRSPMILLLLCASVITAVLSEWIDTVVILAVVFLNIFLGFFHEYYAENTLSKLMTYIKDRIRVIRDNKEQEIDSILVVPGDIVKLSYGTRVPADIRLLNVKNLRIDESVLTGESLAVPKTNEIISITSELTERKNIAYAGTLVTEGYASGICFATGNNTEIGKIADTLSKVKRGETPLQHGLEKLSWFIFAIVILIVIGIFILGLYRGEPLLPMLVLSVSVAVGAVPEALPIALTVILAVGSTRIAKKKGIVKKLAAAETLGSTTLIMTDKTGTLTLAQMQLLGIYNTEQIIYEKDIFENKDFLLPNTQDLLKKALLNIDVFVENPEDEIKDWNFKGKPFEVNIALACQRNNIPLNSLLSKNSSIVLPFNSTNKFSIADDGENFILMGAPDILLKKSKLSLPECEKIEKWIEKTSYEGKRLLSIGMLNKNNHNFGIKIEDIKDIKLLGFFVFFDPIRPEVPEAIKNIESHGLKMVLVTGDLPGTALSVARSLNWNVKENEVLVGSDLRKMKDEELLEIISKIKIFARVTPEDKLRIGTLYQKKGEIVAMTGDGVNDAPALKAMNIGISLGSSTDVAKSAADLVLLDDNFETISLAIDEGRKILANIRKSVVYLLSNSFDEVFVIGGALLFNLALPLTALQIIWVNLFTGSLPALALAFDEDIDKERYPGKNLKLIFTKEVNIFILGIGVLSSLFLFFLYYFLVKSGLDSEIVRSLFFVCFSSYILAITFSFRSLHKSIFSYSIFSNKKLNLSIIFSFILLFTTMTVPFLQNLFSLSSLPMKYIPFVILWLILNILLVEGAKYLIRRMKDFSFKEIFS